MIAEIRFKNMFSFRDEAILSFEADRSKDMESYHVVELGGDVRLLKVAVIYGANASGKSNIIKVCDFIKSFITYTPLNKARENFHVTVVVYCGFPVGFQMEGVNHIDVV